MKGVVFYVAGPWGIFWELWQEPLRFLCEALSQTLPVWIIRWQWDQTTPVYEMDIWDAQGRAITFWGNWKAKKISNLIDFYWQQEEFTPALVVNVYSTKSRLPHYWQRKYQALMLEFSSGAGTWSWPQSGLSQPSMTASKRVLIPADPESVETAHQIGSTLLEKRWAVVFTGWVRQATPFRLLESRYPQQVRTFFGFSWIELESILDNFKAVVLPAPRPHLLGLGWGLPVFYPAPLPYERAGTYPYDDLPTLLSLLERPDVTGAPPKTPLEVANEWLSWWQNNVENSSS